MSYIGEDCPAASVDVGEVDHHRCESSPTLTKSPKFDTSTIKKVHGDIAMRPVVQVTGPSEGGREGMRGHVGYGDIPASKKMSS